MFIFGYLFGLVEGKSIEKGRLEAKERKRREEDLIVLKEQYMLGLLMPIRSQESFKIIVKDSSSFDLNMAKELLHSIESPSKYLKYYKDGDVYILEGSQNMKEEYRKYKVTSLLQEVLAFILFTGVLLYGFMFEHNILHIQNIVPLIVYYWVFFGVSFIVGGMLPLLVFPQRDERVLGYVKL